jgi:tripartite-type tricarboxylate transporter receptor subunit TctC
MRRLAAGLVAAFAMMLLPDPSQGQELSFRDKQITMIIGFPPGGGTDLTGRLVAQFLTKYLPGNPPVIIRNSPGADGITSLNHMAKQTAPDGLTITFGANTQVDPFNYRRPQVLYSPSDFVYLGGARRGGEFIVVNKSALSRVYDKKQPPLVIGTVGNFPRSGHQVVAWTIEHLGWNAKWVGGYRGTPDILLALERDEIDMTAVAYFPDVQRLTATGRFTAAIQSGTLSNGKILARPEAPDVPVFATAMQGKLSDPVAKEAFEYWLAVATMDKWLGILAQTPPDVVEAYRDAFKKLSKDPDFLQQGRKLSEDLVPMSVGEVEALIKTLAATSPQAVQYMSTLLRKQGLEVAQ